MRKLKPINIATLAIVISIFSTVKAQVFQVSINDHITNVLGDFTKNDMTNPNAGYVNFANGSNLEAKYYFKKLGVGVRGSVSNYQRDKVAYQKDLLGELGITDNNYYFTMNKSYISLGGDLGISYMLEMNENFLFEPYFYFGYRTLVTPIDEVVYVENSSTYTYRKNPELFEGISYVPGAKFHSYNSKHIIGLNLYVEYEGVSALTGTEQSVVYSNSTFETKNLDRSFKPQSVNVGLGISFFLGKGLRDNQNN